MLDLQVHSPKCLQKRAGEASQKWSDRDDTSYLWTFGHPCIQSSARLIIPYRSGPFDQALPLIGWNMDAVQARQTGGCGRHLHRAFECPEKAFRACRDAHLPGDDLEWARSRGRRKLART
eukprot:5337580-Amphidinium_carterae.4